MEPKKEKTEAELIQIIKDGMLTTGLKLPENLTFDEWKRIGEILGKLPQDLEKIKKAKTN